MTSPRLAPMFMLLLIIGIIFAAAVPPLGVFLIFLAVIFQARHLNTAWREGIRRQVAFERRVERDRMKLQQEKIIAGRWFGS